MTSYLFSDLWLRDQITIVPHIARIFSFTFSFLATMGNKVPIIVGEVLFEFPLFKLPGILMLAEDCISFFFILKKRGFQVEISTSSKSCTSGTCIVGCVQW